MPQNATFYWNELLTGDAAKARDFYATVVGWTVQEMPMADGNSYTVLMAGDMPAAGMMDKAVTGDPDAPTRWMAYIHVDDVDAAVDRVADAGGTVLAPCFDVEGVGRIAMIQDPTGGIVGIMTAAPQE